MKRLIDLMIVLCAAVVLWGCDHRAEADAIFKKALHSEDSVEKKKLWAEVIRLAPETEQANYCRAALLDPPDPYKRIRLLNAAIRSNPDFAEAYNFRGQVKVDLCFFKFALRDFTAATRIDKQYADAFFNKANIYRIYRYMDESMGAYDTAIMLRPGFTEAWLNRGVTNDMMYKYPEALRDFSKAITLSPGNAEIWLDRGIVKGKMKDYEGSLSDLRKALQLKPNYGKAWHNKGITEYMAGMPDSACVSWKKASDLGIEDAKKALEKFCE